jgi:hypothetical protein
MNKLSLTIQKWPKLFKLKTKVPMLTKNFKIKYAEIEEYYSEP